MLRRLHISARLTLTVTLLSLGAYAEDRYLVKVNGDVNLLAERYGLTVVKSFGGSGKGLHVLASKGSPPLSVLQSLSSEFSVQSAEPEKALRLPGFQPGAPVHPASATQGSTSISSTMIRYYKTDAPSAYVNQP